MSRSRSLAGALQSGVVINEDSADLDFRVESNGNANMLVVNGGDNRVGVGTAAPAATLDVGGGLISDPTIRIDSASGGDPTLIFDGSAANRSALIKFFDNGSTTGGFISYLHNGDVMNFGSGTTATASLTVGDGYVSMPTQPSFSVTPSAAQNNFAVGSHVTVVFDTEIFDVGGNFASNTFTAPVTGKYQLSMRIDLQNIDTAAGFYQYRIETSNRAYANTFDPDHMDSDTIYYGVNLSQLVDMDADDTATVGVYQSSGTQQSDLGTGSAFNGILVG